MIVGSGVRNVLRLAAVHSFIPSWAVAVEVCVWSSIVQPGKQKQPFRLAHVRDAGKTFRDDTRHRRHRVSSACGPLRNHTDYLFANEATKHQVDGMRRLCSPAGLAWLVEIDRLHVAAMNTANLLDVHLMVPNVPASAALACDSNTW
jgi:hypothetical protein